jgi:hypothetical protein
VVQRHVHEHDIELGFGQADAIEVAFTKLDVGDPWASALALAISSDT